MRITENIDNNFADELGTPSADKSDLGVIHLQRCSPIPPVDDQSRIGFAENQCDCEMIFLISDFDQLHHFGHDRIKLPGIPAGWKFHIRHVDVLNAMSELGKTTRTQNST